jgi:hypothetical protein
MVEPIFEKLMFDARQHEARVASGREELNIPKLNTQAEQLIAKRVLVSIFTENSFTGPAWIKKHCSDGGYWVRVDDEIPEVITGVFSGFAEIKNRYTSEEYEKDLELPPDIAIELIDPALPTTNLIPISGVRGVLDAIEIANETRSGRAFIKCMSDTDSSIFDIARMVEILPTDRRTWELFNAILQYKWRPFQLANSVEACIHLPDAYRDFDLEAFYNNEDDSIELEAALLPEDQVGLIYGRYEITPLDIFMLLRPSDSDYTFSSEGKRETVVVEEGEKVRLEERERREKIGKLILSIVPTDGYEITNSGITAVLETSRLTGYESPQRPASN